MAQRVEHPAESSGEGLVLDASEIGAGAEVTTRAGQHGDVPARGDRRVEVIGELGDGRGSTALRRSGRSIVRRRDAASA